MPDTVTIHFYDNETQKLQLKSEYICQTGENLLTVLEKLGFIPDAACAGKGICGACAVQFVKEAPIPGPAERAFFTPEQLRSGMRLACRITLAKDLYLASPMYRKRPDVLFGKLDLAKVEGETMEETVIVADLGTTTIAMELRDLTGGQILGQYAALNPQRRFGADVISRMEAALRSEKEALELQELAVEEVRKGIAYFKDLCPELVKADTKIYLAGNTVMEHLFMGLDVKGLSTYPFTPSSLNFESTCVDGHEIVLLPGISAFVGADIVADLYALHMLPSMHTKEASEKKLLADLGTNAELAYFDGEQLTVTATAAGPAFEGGITAGIFGADLIKMTAELLKQERLDETGLLQGEAFEKGAVIDDVLIQNTDIRKLQLAKAAVAAGICTLHPDAAVKVYLAGGFGYYLDIESAIRIGLLPGIRKEMAEASGNLVPEGTYLIARDLHSGHLSKEQLQEVLAKVKVINLAEMPDFEKKYLEEIDFPTLF